MSEIHFLSDAGTPYVVYYRVPTGSDESIVNAQRVDAKAYVTKKAGRIVGEFVEIETARPSRRAELTAAIEDARFKNATLVIVKLEKLYRNALFLSMLIASRLDFKILDQPDADRRSIRLLAEIAGAERDNISERTREVIRKIKASGVKLGSPDPSIGARAAGVAVAAIADKFSDNSVPVISDLRKRGFSTYRDIADELTRRGIKTSRGGEWHASTVRNLELRQLKRGRA